MNLHMYFFNFCDVICFHLLTPPLAKFNAPNHVPDVSVPFAILNL